MRIVPSRHPPIDLFERVADPADFDAIIELESRTNSRLRDEIGEIALVAPEDRVSGPNRSWIMAPFTHVSGPGGRYSTAAFGAYYAARNLETAIAETVHHRSIFLAATHEPPISIDMRVIHADISARLHDVRGLEASHPELYHLTDYGASRALASTLRAQRSWGIAYDSVRKAGGECAAILRPPALRNCKQSKHLSYVWDGESIIDVREIRSLPID